MSCVSTRDELPLSGQALLDLLRDVLAKGVPFRFRAKGGSMFPLILDGDVLVIMPLRAKTPPLGAVVAFVRPGVNKLVVHRLVARRGMMCLIQGDCSEDGSELVPLGCVLGQVTSVERRGRRVRYGLGPERVLIALLLRMGLLLMVWERTAVLRRALRRRG